MLNLCINFTDLLVMKVLEDYTIMHGKLWLILCVVQQKPVLKTLLFIFLSKSFVHLSLSVKLDMMHLSKCWWSIHCTLETVA